MRRSTSPKSRPKYVQRFSYRSKSPTRRSPNPERQASSFKTDKELKSRENAVAKREQALVDDKAKYEKAEEIRLSAEKMRESYRSHKQFYEKSKARLDRDAKEYRARTRALETEKAVFEAKLQGEYDRKLDRVMADVRAEVDLLISELSHPRPVIRENPPPPYQIEGQPDPCSTDCAPSAPVADMPC